MRVPWCCPRCRGSLQVTDAGASCVGCAARYQRVGPVLDLRVPSPQYDFFTADTERALRLWERLASLGAETFVHEVFASRPGWTKKRIAYRTRQIMSGPRRYGEELDGWLHGAVTAERPFLDLGCGAGVLLAAAASRGVYGIGVDLSMTWLLAAHLLISEHGGTPMLAAALGEALPLPDGQVGGVVSLDVIEHVPQIPAYLREINRVTCPNGHVALSTPNRYSLTPEPHVGLLGVGWLPRAWQKPYVRRFTGDPYELVWLRSARELQSLFDENTTIKLRIDAGPIPTEEINSFGAAKAYLAHTYNRLRETFIAKWFFRRHGPFFRLTGQRGRLS
jgi:SAM-dependent methyltransferase